MTEHYARHCFNFQVEQTFLLPLSKPTNLRLSEADIFEITLGQLRQTVIDFCISQTKVVRLPSIELSGQITDGFVTEALYLGENSARLSP